MQGNLGRVMIGMIMPCLNRNKDFFSHSWCCSWSILPSSSSLLFFLQYLFLFLPLFLFLFLSSPFFFTPTLTHPLLPLSPSLPSSLTPSTLSYSSSTSCSVASWIGASRPFGGHHSISHFRYFLCLMFMGY